MRGEPQEDDQERDPEKDADDALGSEQVVYRSHGKLVSVYSHGNWFLARLLDSGPERVTGGRAGPRFDVQCRPRVPVRSSGIPRNPDERQADRRHVPLLFHASHC